MPLGLFLFEFGNLTLLRFARPCACANIIRMAIVQCASGPPYMQSVAFVSPESLPSAAAVVNDLEALGYTIGTVSSADGTTYASAYTSYLAIITHGQEDYQRIGEVLKGVDAMRRPLLLLATDNPTAHNAAGLAATQIPVEYPAIVRQLTPLLRLATELRQQSQLVLAQQAEIERFRQVAQEQERVQREVEIIKNAIVRNVSHELKTPLLQVKAAVSLMSEDTQNEKLSEYALGAMTRLETLVKNITLLGNSLDINPGPVIVRDAIDYARRNLGRVWQSRGDVDRIHLEIDEATPPAYADKQGLSTVMQLLLDNALKFSSGKVTVIVRPEAQDRIYIGVKDVGIGIAPEELQAIFEMFYQVDTSTTRRYGGSGVGLAIVRLILDRHDTHIQVQSAIDAGSTFSFTLPQVRL